MADLFAVEDVPEIQEVEEEYDTAYKRSYKWNAEKGDFVRDGAGRVVESDGEEAYRTWCIKTAATERYSCLAYPDEIGIEAEEAINEEEPEMVQLSLKRSLTEAMEANPRTEYVGGFSFVWNAEELFCTFTVKGIGMAEFTITV